MSTTSSTINAPIKKYLMGLSLHYQHVYLHPCVINDAPCIVYPFGLKNKSPKFYQKLKQHFSDKGYSLKEDQRSDSKKQTPNQDRRRWMPILLFTASMLYESDALSNNTLNEINVQSSNANQHHIELNLIPSNNGNDKNNKFIIEAITNQKAQTLKSHTATTLYNILRNHYDKQKTDPEFVQSDLKEMANYYTQFPEVISLITSLKQKEWTLRYDENTWSTVASGSALQIDKATIHFNTRSAAKLKLQNSCTENPVCIASPADALLHELLHTHSMLIKTTEFIEQGGMNRFRYPFKHEYAVIKAEKNLYAKMSKQDGIKRPRRNEHTGRKIIASCVTCIK